MSDTGRQYGTKRAQGVLAIMRAELGEPKTAEEMARRLGLSERQVRACITVLRRRRYNIRNKPRVGFWLENGPAPPMGDGPGWNYNWQSEPPTASEIPRRCGEYL